tara:strand:+ start:1072 stop:1572 length:501 start_codon:yes stop_codon:yes gene_type:complete
MKNTPIVVKMQLLVNYHDNKEENYWKFKGGDTVVVYNCETVADAVSFANKIFGNNNKGTQRFPVSWSTLDEYLNKVTSEASFDSWYVDHLLHSITCISPTISKAKFPWAKKTDFGGESFYDINIESTNIPKYLSNALAINEENLGDKYDGYHQEDMSDVDREEPCI